MVRAPLDKHAFGEGAIDLALDCVFSAPLCPITRDLLLADISIHTIQDGATLALTPDLELATMALKHPGGNAAYRLHGPEGTFVYSGDFEHGDAALDSALAGFMRGADLAFLDCTYTPHSYPACKGFGHAHWEAAGRIAQDAGVGYWYGVHHEHTLNDATLRQTETAIQNRFANSALARQGQTYKVAGG